MSASMRVALDAMGGDRAPGEIVLGAVQAAREYGLGVYLVGPEDAIQAVERPGLGGLLPTKEGACMVIDLGANTDCKSEYLQQFALMGSIYMQRILHLKSPRVALLANGEEEGKGNLQVQEAHQLLK